ncbi:DUF1211 domain-containing protein [Aerococcus agrisoli]|uniref:DUF1211 domain-containing protein n=1 Tax=Aerococcus agrisoli TaxID=2487350 RepID=A0A3N4GI37_9LACT|nr:TMEM175 family protein [Aerococcus agrisoli]RPA62452.1 DUF1211 domain-containing protein [Aerococcus agrisoli]
MNKDRLIAFIDAMLAIIMTLLVIELAKPDPVSFEGFWALRENFFAYCLSYFWLGIMWINLHNEWYLVSKINNRTIWATLVMLFFSSLFPYATSIVSEDLSNASAQVFYGIIVLAITFSNMVMHSTVARFNADKEPVHKQPFRMKPWHIIDIIIKVLGLILSATIMPRAMLYALFITLVCLVIPNQINFVRKNIHQNPDV